MCTVTKQMGKMYSRRRSAHTNALGRGGGDIGPVRVGCVPLLHLSGDGAYCMILHASSMERWGGGGGDALIIIDFLLKVEGE